jgi:hypothetical protein
MAIKKLIEDCIKQNKELLAYLDSNELNIENSDKLIKEFEQKLKETHFNPTVCAQFAILLQLSNNEEIFKQYELGDISRLFQCLIDLEKWNLSHYVEAANFEWAVNDNSVKAIELIEIGLENARIKIEELNRLNISIREK